MKLFAGILAALFFMPVAFAGNIKAVQAVLDNEEVKSMSLVEKIEVVAEYKCPQCFDFMVTGERQGIEGLPPEKAFVKLNTEGSLFSDDVTVTVLERSK